MGYEMGKLWVWVSAKKSFNSPYIRIPKHILREMKNRGPNVYYIMLTDDKEVAEKIIHMISDDNMLVVREVSC